MNPKSKEVLVCCCKDLVDKLLESDIGIPLSECTQFDWKVLVVHGLARIDKHRDVKVLKGTPALFDHCSRN